MFQLTWFFSLEGVRKHLKQPVPGEPHLFFISSYLPYSVVLVSVTQPGESATVVTVQSFSHVWLCAAPRTTARPAPLSSTVFPVCSNSCPLSQWCSLTISSSAAPFSFWLPSYPASASASAETVLYRLLVICISFLQKWYRIVLQPMFYLILCRENILTSVKCSHTAPF